MHVSNHGMLLHCQPDEHINLFSKGDSVDIHLTVQHNGEQKKMTIPAHVRHLTENTIDVEFQLPDPVLLDLIESYRTSDTHTLDVVIGNAQTGHDQPEIIPLPGSQLPAKGARTSTGSTGESPESSRRYLAVLALLLGLASIPAGIYLYTNGLKHRLNELEAIAFARNNEISDMQNKLFSASLLEGRYASLDARISAQGAAIASLEQQLQRFSAGNPTPAVMQNTPRASAPKTTPLDNAPETTTALPAAAIDTVTSPELQEPGTTIGPDVISSDTSGQVTGPISRTAPTGQPVEHAIKKATKPIEPVNQGTPVKEPGPWVINLMSSRDRQYLEKIARQAQAKSILTELNSTKVKGRVYWRLQVTGFDSLADAKSRAREIRQSLGIEEVWFLKRKPAKQGQEPGS